MISYNDFYIHFSQRLGIPHSFGKMGMEIFCEVLMQNLEFGDVLEVDSLGYFTYKKVRVNSGADSFRKVILFSNLKLAGQTKNFLLFFIPDERYRETLAYDNALNLSLDKPLLNLKQQDHYDLSFPSSNYEAIGLIESKAEKLFLEGKVYKAESEDEQEFLIPAETERIVFDTGSLDEIAANEEPQTFDDSSQKEIDSTKKIVKVFDDFELVNTENLESITDEVTTEKQWDFDSKSLKNELKAIEDQSVSNKEFSEVTEKFTSKENFAEEKIPELKDDQIGTAKSDDKIRKSRRTVLAVMIIFILILVAAGIYLNYEKIKSSFLNKDKVSQTIEAKKSVQPTIIERTSGITGIYPAAGEFQQVADSMIISSEALAAKQNEQKESLTSEITPSSSITNEQITKLVKVQGNIFQRGDEFVVQVSSWKSKSVAEREVNKFNENGFKAELMESKSSDVGKYYKVMVGGFNSLDDAKNFYNQYK